MDGPQNGPGAFLGLVTLGAAENWLQVANRAIQPFSPKAICFSAVSFAEPQSILLEQQRILQNRVGFY